MIKLLKNLKKREIILILFIIILIVSQVWLDLKLPDYMSKITALIQNGNNGIKGILKEGSKMLLCAFGSLIGAFIVGYAVANIAASFTQRVREKVFKKVEEFSMEEIKKFSISSLITRTTNDINQVQFLIVMGLQMIIKAPIMAIWALQKISNKGFEFTLITACGVFAITLVIIVLILLVMPKFKKMQVLTDNLTNVTRENLTGIRVIRAFNAEDFQKNKFSNANQELTDTQMFTQRAMAFLNPFMSLIMAGITLSIYWVGAYLIDQASMLNKIELFSNVVVFSSYAIQVIISFMFLIMIFVLYPRASVAAKRINEVLDTKAKIKDGDIKENSNDLKGIIEFKKVCFKYPDAEEYMLKDISFKINTGETVAFIGSTGSGKSTLINLIPRFYDVSDGEILLDGINIKDYNLEYLYNKIGYISQKAILFRGSIKENVGYGNKKISLAKIKKAVKIAQAKDFVEKTTKKYDSYIAQNGTNISGGQKQRLSIARAIAKDPEVLIFDDSFSALDYKTDYNLRKELKKHTKDTTILIVAQRIGTIKNADKIIVLDNGNCVGMGSHNELMKKCKIYQEIALSQLSKEELANE